MTSSASALPTAALLDLATSRDGFLRWVRLRALRNTLVSEGADQASLDELDALLSAALPEAEAHAARLADFYRTYAEAVDALLADASDGVEDARLRARLASAGPGFAAVAEARARSLAGAGRPDPETDGPSTHSDPATETFCAYLSAAQLESDVACISTGDSLECQFGNLLASLSDTYC